jgi:hypothetical protein
VAGFLVVVAIVGVAAVLGAPLIGVLPGRGRSAGAADGDAAAAEICRRAAAGAVIVFLPIGTLTWIRVVGMMVVGSPAVVALAVEVLPLSVLAPAVLVVVLAILIVVVVAILLAAVPVVAGFLVVVAIVGVAAVLGAPLIGVLPGRGRYAGAADADATAGCRRAAAGAVIVFLSIGTLTWIRIVGMMVVAAPAVITLAVEVLPLSVLVLALLVVIFIAVGGRVLVRGGSAELTQAGCAVRELESVIRTNAGHAEPMPGRQVSVGRFP